MPKNDQIVKTIIGFSNRHGGEIVIGVDDDCTIEKLGTGLIVLFNSYIQMELSQKLNSSLKKVRDILHIMYEIRIKNKIDLSLKGSGRFYAVLVIL